MAKKEKETQVIEETIFSRPLDELMGDRFATYSKYVIQDRSIPDVRDGLKPVQRRILYSMWMNGNTIEKPTKKCAHIVGDVMGKYHPHGDSSIYEALAHMSQEWCYRNPLVDFQGNNGSIDGDEPAAYRYTEARLSKLSNDLLLGLDEDTVDMDLTFDDSSFEPSVLPARFPNLLANGSDGIAVGISTAIPPHNLKEVIDCIIYRIRHPECGIEKLMDIVKAPDFPTGGLIVDNDSLKDIYLKGRGKCTIVSKMDIETDNKGKRSIVITEIPYQVNKSELVKSIDKFRHDKTLPGILEVRDETDKDGIRIAIDLKDEANEEAIMTFLKGKTRLRDSYSAHLVAIVDNHPQTLNLLTYADCYIQHQLEVVSRRSKFLLGKSEKRLEVVMSLIDAIGNLDEVVAIIKKSTDKADAKKKLAERFSWNFDQAEAVVMMPLYRLSHTDIQTLETERDGLEREIRRLNELLSDQGKREEDIILTLKDIQKRNPSPRKSQIVEEEETPATIDKRDLIAKEECFVVATRDGYLKRSSVKSYKSSHGDKGARPGIKLGDAFRLIAQATTKDYVLLFTDRGNYLYIPVNEIRETKWNDEGFHVSNLVSLAPMEKIVNGFALSEFRKGLYVVTLSKRGYIKRMELPSLVVQRRSKTISAMRLGPTDALVDAAITSGASKLFLASIDGKASFYPEWEVPLTNPKSGGVKAGSFKGKDLVALLSFDPEEKETEIAIVTDRAHTRVFDLSHIELLGRLSRSTILYSDFKNEPHNLLFLDKVGKKKAPYSYEAVTEDGERLDIAFNDFYWTPLDKRAKRPADFKKGSRLVLVSKEPSLLIDESFKCFEAPKVERAEPQNPFEREERKTESQFEQMSLLDED